jgi:hypothetical protein
MVVTLIGVARTRPGSGEHLAAWAGFLFAGAPLAWEAIVFLVGRHLWQPRRSTTAGMPSTRGRRRWLGLAVYLAGSVGIGLAAGLGFRMGLPESDLLGFLVGQPTFFIQVLLGGVMGLQLESEPVRQTIVMAANLLYFPAFFYPMYGLAVLDRAVEVVRYRRMRILLILFSSAHVLLGTALATLMRA